MLVRSHAELDRIINTANDGMRIIDKECNVLRVNTTFQALTGLTEAEMVGRKCYEAFPGPGCHTAGCAVTRIVAGEQLIVNESEKLRQNGDRVTCIVRATPLADPSSGELLGIVESFTDITERKKLEEEREELIARLSRSLEEIKTLKGIVPICSHCKKIRGDDGYWNQLEKYIHEHSEAQLSHGICPDCLRENYSTEDGRESLPDS
jgi:PAS domain S-box-containing protein